MYSTTLIATFSHANIELYFAIFIEFVAAIQKVVI